MKKSTAVSLCLAILAQPAAALACNAPRDVAALKTAALQQRLMVAALTCRAGTSYNRFVLAYRSELQRSDADLKAYFVAQGGESGEAAYDTYKTKVANLAARGPAIDTRAFCAAAADEFDALASRADGLTRAVAAEKLPATVCAAPALAAAVSRPLPGKGDGAEQVAGISAALPSMPYSKAPPPVARMVAQAEPIAPEDIVPPEEYAQDERSRDRADEAAPARLAYAPRRREGDRYEAERYEDYAPPPPAYARGERYWYYRSLYARPRVTYSYRD